MFEFLLLSHQCLYLGENRRDKSPGETEDGIMLLQPEVTLRHELFEFYVEQWAYGNYAS